MTIEILSLGGQFDQFIEETAQLLIGVQKEFYFTLAPPRLRAYGQRFAQPTYRTKQVWKFLEEYRVHAKGDRRFLIGLVDKRLDGVQFGNLFGSHDAKNGVAAITLADHRRFLDSTHLYLCYYFIRYALSFVCPSLKGHEATRGCFFDKKIHKPDIKISVDSGNFCEDCRRVLWGTFNDEINTAIQKMVAVMKAQRADSVEPFEVGSLKDQIDIGIITIRDDEFQTMINRFATRRRVVGAARTYTYSKLINKAQDELRVVVGQSPNQGQAAAQALASSLITEIAPRWIFLVGIAGGLPDPEYTLGDVLLSQRMHDFAVTAAIEGKEPAFQDLGGPMAVEVEKIITGLQAWSHELGPWSSKEFLGRQKPCEKVPRTAKVPKLRDQDLFYGDDTWRRKVWSSLTKEFPRTGQIREPLFRAAVMISSNTLVKDTKLAQFWQRTARHACGVEMELGGVCQAARYLGNGKTRVLAIRGLSDIVGYRRASEWTGFACHSAAAFTHALIASGIIRRKT